MSQKPPSSFVAGVQKKFSFKAKFLGFFILVMGIAGSLAFFYPNFFLKFIKSEDDPHKHLILQNQDYLKDALKLLEALTIQVQDLKKEHESIKDQLDQLKNLSQELSSLRPPNHGAFSLGRSASLETSAKDFSEMLQDTLPKSLIPHTALKDLALKIESGKPFEEAYKALYPRLNISQKALLKILEPYQTLGIPKKYFLKTQFLHMRAQAPALNAEKDAPSSTNPSITETWTKKALSLFKSFVIISQQGDQKNALNQGLNEIQKALDHETFPQALRLSQGLPISWPEKEQWEIHLETYTKAQMVLYELRGGTTP